MLLGHKKADSGQDLPAHWSVISTIEFLVFSHCSTVLFLGIFTYLKDGAGEKEAETKRERGGGRKREKVLFFPLVLFTDSHSPRVGHAEIMM